MNTRSFFFFLLAANYWKERKSKFNFCGRTRGVKLHLCRVVLGSKEYNQLEIDGTRADPTPCKKRKFKFLNPPQLDETEGIQALKMYPCITHTNPQERYFLSGTGDREPSLYLFYEDPQKDKNNNYPIYFEAKITDINMDKLKKARENEKILQREMLRDGPIAEPDETAIQGPLIPSEIKE